MNRREFLKKGFGAIAATTILGLPKKSYEKENQNWEKIKFSIDKLENKFDLQPDQYAVVVSPSDQRLYLVKNKKIEYTYP